MSKEYIFTGKTIDDAISAGCSELGVDRDSISVEVLEAPSKSFLGLLSTNAKIKIIVKDPEPQYQTFISDVLRILDIDAEIKIEKNDDVVNIELIGENMGLIIGRRGETLDALQYLTSLVANRGSEEFVKINIDTENYRKKREDSLIALANKMAARVQKYKKSITLEPMNPFERRIIHSTLQNNKFVSTSSVGTEPNRRVVIFYNGPDTQKRHKPKNQG